MGQAHHGDVAPPPLSEEELELMKAVDEIIHGDVARAKMSDEDLIKAVEEIDGKQNTRKNNKNKSKKVRRSKSEKKISLPKRRKL